MGLQFSIRESADVTILDLQERVTIGVDSDLLNVHLKKLVAQGVRKLLLNLEDVTQLDSLGRKKSAWQGTPGPKDAVRGRKMTVRRAFKAFRFNALTRRTGEW